MAEKDALEKTLLDYPEVFADIWNVLVFGGRPVILERELSDALPRSIYKADGKVHEQERDVAKFWKRNMLKVALLGVENQSAVDEDIVLRAISYDGAAYRAEMNADKKGEPKVRYPVVTIVLYFGWQKHWDKARRLKDRFAIPEDLKPFVNDYKVHIIEVAWLSARKIAKMQSDFKVVADFFRKMRLGYEKKKPYHPLPAEVRHVREVLELLSAVSGDRRFEEKAEQWNAKERFPMEATMTSILDEYLELRKKELEEKAEKRGEKRGKVIGKELGKELGEKLGEKRGEKRGKILGAEATWVKSVRNIMRSMKLSAQEAIEAVKVPKNLRQRVLEQV